MPQRETVYGDDPRWGCAYPGCSAHPANPKNGGPLFRISAKGEAWVGACGKHYDKLVKR